MEENKETKMEICKEKAKSSCNTGTGGCVWFLGFVGSAIYFIQHADAFWPGVLGFLKALVWPVFLVYKLLEHVYM